jgi:hypothetical protein
MYSLMVCNASTFLHISYISSCNPLGTRTTRLKIHFSISIPIIYTSHHTFGFPSHYSLSILFVGMCLQSRTSPVQFNPKIKYVWGNVREMCGDCVGDCPGSPDFPRTSPDGAPRKWGTISQEFGFA